MLAPELGRLCSDVSSLAFSAARAAAWPVIARAQQATPVIGILGSAAAPPYRERLTLIRQGLAETGFVERLG
jgi:hypothetical protein